MTVFQPADDRKIRELIQANKPLVIYFREPSSNLCQLLDPLVDEVCSRLTRTFNFVSVNVSEKKISPTRCRSCVARPLFFFETVKKSDA